jgi:hypothetical protein
MLIIFSILLKFLKNIFFSRRNKIKVKNIFIYPIKSCSGIELKECDIVNEGFLYDRK